MKDLVDQVPAGGPPAPAGPVRIGTLMSRPVLTVAPEVTLDCAAQTMVERSVGALVVTRGDAPAGILTERDVLRAVARGLVPWTTTVADCMTPDPAAVTPDDTVDDALALMQRGRFRHLPVVEGGALAGIVSMRDLAGLRFRPGARPPA